jgi:hypothetical protein
MADISKCNDFLCPSKNKCYRFTAPASEFWQSYTNFNRDGDADNCEYYWEVNIEELNKTDKIIFDKL